MVWKICRGSSPADARQDNLYSDKSGFPRKIWVKNNQAALRPDGSTAAQFRAGITRPHLQGMTGAPGEQVQEFPIKLVHRIKI